MAAFRIIENQYIEDFKILEILLLHVIKYDYYEITIYLAMSRLFHQFH